MKIVYYSTSGNTEVMAQLMKDGIEAAGKQAELIVAADANADEIANEEVIILGCSAYGAEQLDEEYMEPLVNALSDKVNGKKVALFGSYSWGEGEWMKEWEERMKSYGAQLVGDGLIIQETPEDDEAVEACKVFGKMLANL
ncbi:flavodoxin [Cellulosilyticum ruminicola]|uniref:flavodoxin n=1 Tax=Cellulosilyticum ruminicola TaxID=425254 RepID=UPI0006D0F073|nr:flavodoxin [Cellulosilyticum ruminicola]